MCEKTQEISTLKLIRDCFGHRALLTIKEAALILGQSPNSLYNAATKGRRKLPTIRLNGQRPYVRVVDLVRYIEEAPSAAENEGVRDE